jgi:hypothetical protein
MCPLYTLVTYKTDTDRDRQTQTQTLTDTDRDRQAQTQTLTDTDTDRDRQAQTLTRNIIKVHRPNNASQEVTTREDINTINLQDSNCPSK